MDGVQKLLIVVVISLTALLVIVGIQVIFIIKDVRRALKRLNSMLDDSILGGGLIRPDKLTSVFEMFKSKFTKRGDGGSGGDGISFPLE
jgi:hypothetical protein